MERWTYDSRRRGEHRILQESDAIACFYEEGWQDGNCIFNQRLSLAVIPLVFVMTGAGKRYISEREKELYCSVFFGLFYLLCGSYCVFSSFIVLFFNRAGP